MERYAVDGAEVTFHSSELLFVGCVEKPEGGKIRKKEKNHGKIIPVQTDGQRRGIRRKLRLRQPSN